MKCLGDDWLPNAEVFGGNPNVNLCPLLGGEDSKIIGGWVTACLQGGFFVALASCFPIKMFKMRKILRKWYLKQL